MKQKMINNAHGMRTTDGSNASVNEGQNQSE